MQTPTLGILMLLVSFGLVVLVAASFVVARLARRPPPVRNVALATGGWALVYLATLVGTSLASEPRVLDVNEDKKFCGFYLDCHLQLAVAGVDTARALGPAAAPVRATGVFVVVTLRVSSDAKRADMRFIGPRLVVRDAAGRTFERVAAAEAAVAAGGAPAEPLTRVVSAGDAFLTTVVFDLPADAAEPRLFASDGFWAERIVERLLIGDEDSFLHRRTAFRLAVGG
jgi:hypothetical protein